MMEILVDGVDVYKCDLSKFKEIFGHVKLAYDVSIARACKKFSVGTEVSFQHKGMTITGTVTKQNQKTISIKSSNGPEWNVSPGLLTLVVKATSHAS